MKKIIIIIVVAIITIALIWWYSFWFNLKYEWERNNVPVTEQKVAEKLPVWQGNDK